MGAPLLLSVVAHSAALACYVVHRPAALQPSALGAAASEPCMGEAFSGSPRWLRSPSRDSSMPCKRSDWQLASLPAVSLLLDAALQGIAAHTGLQGLVYLAASWQSLICLSAGMPAR